MYSQVFITADLHGCKFDEFLKLLDKAGYDKEKDILYVLGDVVDRGYDGIKILKWIIQEKNIVLLLGNHEEMMLNCEFLYTKDLNNRKLPDELYGVEKTFYRMWLNNGGLPTLNSLRKCDQQDIEQIIHYIKNCPLYKIIEMNGKKYILSHSGGDPMKKHIDNTKHDWLWSRPKMNENYIDNTFRVFGHTPVQLLEENNSGKPIINSSFIDLDGGASFGYFPIVLRLNDLKVFTYID